MTEKLTPRYKGLGGTTDFSQYAEAALRLAEEASKKQDRIIELLNELVERTYGKSSATRTL